LFQPRPAKESTPIGPGHLPFYLQETRDVLDQGAAMTSIQPELWVDRPRDALTFYQAAFGATVLHRVGEGDDIVAQLGVAEAAFWVAPTSWTMKPLRPRSIDGATSRTLLVVNDPETLVRQAVAAGATEASPLAL
jgi:PhnB protein